MLLAFSMGAIAGTDWEQDLTLRVVSRKQHIINQLHAQP
jgi:hypothetical protein